MPIVKAEFVEYLKNKGVITISTIIRDHIMSEKENELPDPAKLLKKVLAEAHFENTDIGGVVFSMLDSLSFDIIATGFEHSDATEDLMQEVVNILAKDYDDIRTDDLEDEEDEIVQIEPVEDDTEDSEEGSRLSDEIITAIKEVEEVEEVDDIQDLPDLSDLEEVSNGPGNQEVANK